jgi:hypothetical protein
MLEAWRLFGDNGVVKTCINEAINGLWGSKLYVFMKQQRSSEAFQLEGSMKHRHQDQAVCARKRYGLARFLFYRSQGVC